VAKQRETASDDPAGKVAIASKRVAEQGRKVRFMYREDPRLPGDSGWKFFSGDEPQEYVDDPDNVGEYPLETIARIDPSVVPLLETPAPCAFERDGDDEAFVESDFDLWLEE
jgi:hypothetical protein